MGNPSDTANKRRDTILARTYLITGCSRGLGRALAEAILESCDRLVATARDPAALADLVTVGGDSVVVNNAGYGNVAPIEDTGLDAYRTQIETNLFGTIIVTKAAIPHFRNQRSGRLIQIS